MQARRARWRWWASQMRELGLAELVGDEESLAVLDRKVSGPAAAAQTFPRLRSAIDAAAAAVARVR